MTSTKQNEPEHEIVMVETEIGSAQFIGEVATFLGSAAAVAEPQIINVLPGTIITVYVALNAADPRLEQSVVVLYPGELVVSSTIVPGDVFQVQLFDADLNLDSQRNDEVVVSVSVSCIPLSLNHICPPPLDARPIQGLENITLRESSPTSSLFTGTLETFLQTGASAPHDAENDGAIDIRGQSDSCSADILSVTYLDETPMQIVQAMSTTAFRGTVSVSHEVMSATTNSSTIVSVQDQDLINSSSVQIVLLSSKEDEPTRNVQLDLTTCYPVPTFSGNFSLEDEQLLVGGAAISVRPSDLISVVYADAGQNKNAKSYIRIATDATVVAGPTIIGRSYLREDTALATIAVGGDFELTVTDVDQDTDPTSVNSVSVFVSSQSNTSNFTLYESGLSTGVFTGSICTAEQELAGCISRASAGQMLNVTYDDFAADGSTVARHARIRVSTPGSIVLTASSGSRFEAGQELLVEVFDPDLNQLPDTAERAPVLIKARDTEDTEVVYLSETSTSSAYFTGAINTTVDAGSHSGLLLVETATARTGTVIENAYADVAPPSGRLATLKVCSPASVAVEPLFFVAGTQNLSITVIDADMQLDPLALDSLTVNVSSATDLEMVRLTETDLGTSVFSAQIRTLIGAATNFDGVLQLPGLNEIVLVAYEDQCPSAVRSPPTSPRSSSGATLSAQPELVRAGTAINITLAQASLNQNDSKVETWVDLVSVSTSAMERLVTMTETYNNSGVFTGSIGTSLTVEADTLQLPDITGTNSNPITISYGDTQLGGTSLVVLESHRTGIPSLVQSGVDSARVNIGRSVSVRVLDKDLDYGHGLRTTNVTLVTTGGDQEVVILEAEGSSTGAFTGSIATQARAGAIGDGVLDSLATGDDITLQYTDDDESVRIDQVRCGHAGVVTVGSVLTGFDTSVTVTVTDPDLNQNAGAAEEYTIFAAESVLNLKRGILNYPIHLIESSTDSSQFTAVINFYQDSIPASQRPGCEAVINSTCSIPRLEPTTEPEDAATVVRWDRIEIAYSDPEVVGGAGVRADVANRATKYLAPGQNGAVTAPSTVAAGSELSITVTDQDESANEDGVDTISVTVVSSRSNERDQRVVLYEIGLEERTFTGFLRTREDVSENTNKEGIMHVSVEDSLEIVYRDNAAYVAANHNQTWTASVVVSSLFVCRAEQEGSICSGVSDEVSCGAGFCAAATPTLSVDNFVIGSCVGATLVDSDQSTDAAAIETVTVTAENTALKDRELITLTEAGTDSIMFTGCVQSLQSSSGEVGVVDDGLLSVSTGDTVTVYYSDILPVVSISRTRSAVASQVGTVSVSPPSVQVGRNVSVTVADFDLDADSSRVDAAEARVVTAGDMERIILTETGVSSAVFTGTLRTTADAVDRNGTLDQSREGDTITAEYIDELPDNNAVRQAQTVFGRVGLLSMTEIRAEGWGEVILVDQQPLSVPYVNVTLTSTAADGSPVDVTDLQLLVHSDDPVTFSGRYAVTSAANADPSSPYPTLTATSAGNQISVLYQDLSPTLSISKQAFVQASDPGTLYTSPPQLLSGNSFSITIVDQDMNLDSSVVDHAVVRVTSSDEVQQPEQVTLIESSPASGTFTGMLETTQGSASQAENDGRIDANAGDVLLVEYFEIAPIGTLQNALPVLPSVAGLLSLQPVVVGVGGVISVTVNDADENTDDTLVETALAFFQVADEGGHAGPPVTVHLFETATDTGSFTAHVRADIPAGSSMAFSYADSAPDATTIMTAVVAPSFVGVVELGPVNSEEMYDLGKDVRLRKASAGDIIMVTVFDPDLNADAQVSEAASATALATSTSNTVHVPLRESGPDTSTFTGEFLTRLKTSQGTDADARAGVSLDALDVAYGDQLTAIYQDAAPRAERRSDHFVRIWMPGSVLLLPQFALPGNTFSITVSDGDRDRNGTLREEIMVSIHSSRVVGQSLNVTLLETSTLSGTFTGSLPSQEWVSTGRSDTGILNLVPGDVLTVVYSDNFPSDWQATSSASVRSTSCNCATLQVVPDHISAGEDVTIVVNDPDAAGQGSNTLFVRVENNDRQRQVQTLLELQREAETNVFSGVVTSVNTAIEKVTFLGADNVINVLPGEDLQVTYLSVESSGTVEKTASVYVEIVGVLTLNPEVLIAGEQLSITVDDQDLDLTVQREGASVIVRSDRASEPDKRIDLFETGLSTGRFTGTLVTVDSPDIGDLGAEGTMNVQKGNLLSVVYNDELPRVQDIEQVVPVALEATITIDPVPLRENGIFMITVANIDANRQQTALDTLSVNVSTPRTFRTFSLVETGVNTGEFTTSLSLSDSPDVALSQTVLFPVEASEHITVEYLDPAPNGVVVQSAEVLQSASATLIANPVLQSGGRLQITVVDPDFDGGVDDFLTVSARTRPGRQEAMVALRRSTPNSPQFEGMLDTNGLELEQREGSIFVAAGDTVDLAYLDPSPQSWVYATTEIQESQQGTLSVNLERVQAGGQVLILVEDADLDASDTIDNVVVTAESSIAPSGEPVEYTLTETGTSTGVFSASIQAEIWEPCSSFGFDCQTEVETVKFENSIFVLEGESISFTYTDSAPFNTSKITIPICTTAQIKVHTLLISIGQMISIEVHDVDMVGHGNVSVTVFPNGTENPGENFSLPEDRPGVFMTSLRTNHEHTTTDSIALIDNSRVYFVYEDECPSVDIMLEARAYIQSTLEFSLVEAKVGELVTVTVEDRQRKTELDINISCFGSDGDTQEVRLDQQPFGSGFFVGIISPGNLGNVSAVAGGSIRCQYAPPLPPTFVERTLHLLPSDPGFLTFNPEIFRVGGEVAVQLSDSDLNLDPNAGDSAGPVMTFITSVDRKTLSLEETGLDTAQFTGVITLSDIQARSSLADTLVVVPGEVVIVEYLDRVPYTVQRREVLARESTIGKLNLNPGTIGVGGKPRILVADADLNLDPESTEQASVYVSVTSPGAVDGIRNRFGRTFPMNTTVMLTEIGTNTEYFSGSLTTIEVEDAEPLPAGSRDTVNVMVGYTVTIAYSDAAPKGQREYIAVVQPSLLAALTITPFTTLGEPLTITINDPDVQYDPGQSIEPEIRFTVGVRGCGSSASAPDCVDSGSLKIVPTTSANEVFTATLTPFDGPTEGVLGPCFLTCTDVRARSGDYVSFFYDEVSPEASHVARAKVASKAVLVLDPVGTEGLISVTVFDQDLDLNGTVPDSSSVSLSLEGTGNDVQTLAIVETSVDSGIFTTMIETTTAGVAGANMLPNVGVGVNVTAQYFDAEPDPMSRTASAIVVASNLGTLTFEASKEQVSNIVIGGNHISIIVTDVDLRYSSVSPDFTSVLATSSRLDQGSETILLTEQGVDSGIFTGRLYLTVGSFNGAADDGAIDVLEGDFITFEYWDRYPNARVRDVAKIATVGSLEMNPDPVSSGSPIFLTVVDADLNTDEHTVDTGEVLVENADSSDSEIVVVTEIGTNSSVFVGSLPTTPDISNIVGTLTGVAEQSIVTATYEDAIPDFLNGDCGQCVVQKNVAMIGNITAGPRLLPVAGTITITLTDQDLNLDPLAADTVIVTARQYFREPFDEVPVQLVEVGLNTGLFAGQVTTSPVFGEAELYGPEGGRIRVTYYDRHPMPRTNRSSTVTISMIGLIELNPSPLNPDATLLVTVYDDDMDVTLAPDATSRGLTTVSHPDDAINPDGVSLLLLETGPSTGAFTGEMQTQTAVSVVAGTLIGSAASGTYVAVSYTDANPFGTRVQLVRIASSATFVLKPDVLDEGVPIELTVTDADLNDDPTVAENATVLLQQTQSLTPTIQNITLFESGVDSDIFTATVLASGTGSGGTFIAPAGSLVTAQYVDRNPTPTNTLTIERRVSIFGDLQVTQSNPTADTVPCFIFPGLTTCTGFTYNDFSIIVVDSDLTELDSPSVTIYNSKGFESEVVTMTYTGSDNRFTGTLTVVENSAEGDSNTLALNIDQGDVIQVVYADAAPPINNIFEYQVPTAATASFQNSDILVGSDDHIVVVSLVDADIAGSNSATVTVYTDGADSETLILTETANLGTFTGRIGTENSRDHETAGDGIVQIGSANSLSVAYSDANPASVRGTSFSTDLIEFRGLISTDSPIVLGDGTLSITVVDCDLPLNPTNPLQSYVTVSIPDGDSVVLTLTQQESDCGTYTGTVATSTRADLKPQVLGGAVPGTLITATYLDCSDNAPQDLVFKIALLGALAFGNATAERTVGLPLSVTLADQDLDVSSLPDTATIVVSTAGANADSETMMLTETAGSSGSFTGSIDTSRFRGAREDGTLHGCVPGYSVTAVYMDQQPLVNVSASLIFEFELGSASLRSISPALVSGGIIAVTVIDMDLNHDQFAIETYRPQEGLVTLTSAGDIEAITLREKARNSAVFTGTIETSRDIGAQQDGTLRVLSQSGNGSLVEMTYADTFPSSGSFPTLCSAFGVEISCNFAKLRSETPGVLRLSATSYTTIGEQVQITVIDEDRNLHLAQEDSVDVVVSILPGGESVTIPLLEMGVDVGVFTAQVLVSSSGVLSTTLLPVSNANTIRFVYQDVMPGSHVEQLDIAPKHLGDLSDTFNVLLAGGALRVVLNDMDLNIGTLIFDTYEGLITVRSADSLEVETVTVTETDTNSGIFTGILKTEDDQFRGIDFSGSMKVQPGDVLVVQYEDTAPLSLVQRNVRVATKGVLSHSPLHIYLDYPLTVTVEDLDEDRDATRADRINNLVTVRLGANYQDLSLTETGPSTGVFTGQVTLSAEASAAGTFGPLVSGDFITLTYRDEFPLDEFEKVLPVFEKGSISISPSPAMDVVNENLEITVMDADLNTDPLSIEYITTESGLVYVTTGTGITWVDFEYIEAVETGRNTGVFTAQLDVSNSLSATSNSGVLSPVLVGSLITAHYQDLAPTMLARAYSSPGTDGVLTVAPSLVGAGVEMTFTVTDEDVNFDSTISESVQVTVTTDRSREGAEVLTLVERGVDSGIFTGSLQTVRSAAYSNRNDGVLNVVTGTCFSDTACSACESDGCTGYVVTTYVEASPPQTLVEYSAVGYVGEITSCTNADIATDYCLFRQDLLFVTVTDPDLNTDPASMDVGDVLVFAEFFSHSTGAVISTFGLPISVQETGVDTNVFVSAAVPTATSNLAGQLQIYDSGTITKASTLVTAQYPDAKSGNPIVLTRLQTPATLDLKSAAGSTTFPIGEPLYVTVVDGDMDITASAPDTVEVEVTATAGPTVTDDEQFIVLTETGNQTSVFTAILATAVAQPSCDDTLLSIVYSSAAVVTARYVDVGLSDKAPQNALTLTWPGSVSFAENFTYINQTLTILVTDLDLAGGAAPTVQFESTLASGIVPIGTAVGSSTDVFSGTLDLSQDVYGDPTGVARNTLTAKYYDDSHSVWRTSTIQVQPRGLVLIDAFGAEISLVTITVLDSSADVSDEPDSVKVFISTEVGGSGLPAYQETETLNLTETSIDSGEFTGSIPLRRAAAPDSNSGILDGDLGDLSIANGLSQPVISVTYEDLLPPATVVTTQNIACQGSFVLPATFEIGTLVPVVVSDCDLAAEASNTIMVTIDFPRGNSTSQVTLYRDPSSTTAYSASFSGNFTTSSDVVNCTATVCGVRSSARKGSQLILTYEDKNPASNISTTMTANTPASITVTQTHNGQASSNDKFKIGDRSVISVEDRDANIQPDAADTIRILVYTGPNTTVPVSIDGNNITNSSNTTNASNCTVLGNCATVYDVEELVLVETGHSSNTFTGWLLTDVFAPVVVGDGRISPVASGSNIQIKYFDPTPGVNVTVTVIGTDFQGISISQPIPPITGANITAQVLDTDLDVNSSEVDSHPGLLTFSACSQEGLRWCSNSSLVGEQVCEAIAVTLTEAATSSATFEGHVLISSCLPTTRVPGTLVLFCEGTAVCNVTATYTDVNWGVFSVSQATQRSGVLNLTSTPGVPQQQFVAGEQLTISLEDGDADLDSLLPDTAHVVLNVSGRSYHFVLLTETENSTGVFTGQAMTYAVGEPPSLSGDAIPVMGGDQIEANYVDPDPQGHVAQFVMTATSRASVQSAPDVVVEANHDPGVAHPQLITITVVDQDELGAQVNVSVVASGVLSSPVQDEEVVVLSSTGGGVFTGQIETAYSVNTSDPLQYVEEPSKLFYQNLSAYKYSVTYAQPGTNGASGTRYPVSFLKHAVDGVLSVSASIRAGQLLQITVEDNDRDLDWEVVDTVEVVVTSSKLHESQEVLTLRETSVTSDHATFTGQLTTAPSGVAGGASDGCINVLENDVLVVTYREVVTRSGAASILSSTVNITLRGEQGQIWLVDPESGNARSMLVNQGSTMNILVTDPDDEGFVRSGSVTLSSPTETLTVSMTNASALGAGEYLLLVATSPSPTDTGAMTLDGCSKGSVIVVQYHDSLPYSVVTAEAVVNQGAVLSASPQPVGMGDSVVITVNDPDLDADPSVPDTGLVYVASDRFPLGTETLPITETGASTSTFTAVLKTALRPTVDAVNNGAMNVQRGDRLSIQYVEKALGNYILDATKTKSLEIKVGEIGTLTALVVVTPGLNLTVTVVDADLALTAETLQQARAVLTTSKDGETETIQLTQTGPGSDEFTGVVRTCTRCLTEPCPDICSTPPCGCLVEPCNTGTINCPSELEGPSEDGVLYVEEGDLITVSYTDMMPETTLLAFSHVERTGSLEVVPPQYLVGGDTLNLIIVDSDNNNDPSAVETVLAFISTSRLNEANKVVTLVEDGLNSGRFVGGLPTVANDPQNPSNALGSDPFMVVEPGNVLVIDYDAGSWSDSVSITVAAAGHIRACVVGAERQCESEPSFDGPYEVAAAMVGDSITINVTDFDLPLDSVVEVTAHADPTASADMEVVFLQRVEGSVFSGVLPTSQSDGQTPRDGTLNVLPGTLVTLTYDDDIPRVTQKAFIRMAIVGTVQVEARLIHDTPNLAVTVSDIDMNRNSSLRETLVVAARNARNANSPARLSLIESAPASGIFQGAISLTYSAALEAVNDGTLRGISGDHISFSYSDSMPAGERSGAVNLTFAGTVRLPGEVLPGGQPATITIIDADLDVDPSVADSHFGAIAVFAAGEPPALLDIRETGGSTGIFTASILPVARGFEEWGSPAADGGTRVVADLAGDIAVQYVDAGGGGNVTVRAAVHLQGTLMAEISDAGPVSSSGISVTLVDPDLMSQATSVSVRVSSTSSGAPTLLQLQQLEPGSPVFAGSLSDLLLRDSDQIVVEYDDALPQDTVTLALIAPQPRFVAPTPEDGAVLHTAVGCILQVLLRAQNEADSAQRLESARVTVRASRHSLSGSGFVDGLPAGAALAPVEAGESVTTSLSWKPTADQEGLLAVVCFVVEVANLDVGTGAEESERCMQVKVGLCQMCTAPGDSLQTLAAAFGSDWRALWSINPDIDDPAVLGDGQLLKTAMLYRAAAGDSLSALAARFGLSVEALLQRNSQLSLSESLPRGQSVCVLPVPARLDACPEPAKSSTWEALEEQYVPPDYWDNPYNWEHIVWTDLQGQPVKTSNPDYPQLPAEVVGEEPGYASVVDSDL